jgi:hypothetical protein
MSSNVRPKLQYSLSTADGILGLLHSSPKLNISELSYPVPEGPKGPKVRASRRRRLEAHNLSSTFASALFSHLTCPSPGSLPPQSISGVPALTKPFSNALPEGLLGCGAALSIHNTFEQPFASICFSVQGELVDDSSALVHT